MNEQVLEVVAEEAVGNVVDIATGEVVTEVAGEVVKKGGKAMIKKFGIGGAIITGVVVLGYGTVKLVKHIQNKKALNDHPDTVDGEGVEVETEEVDNNVTDFEEAKEKVQEEKETKKKK